MDSNIIQIKSKDNILLQDSNKDNVNNSAINNNNSNIKSYSKILYDKKWLFLIGFILISLLLYIYYNDIPIQLPPILTPINLTKNSKIQKDDIEEINDDENCDEWDLENEIEMYMEKQHNYINKNN